MTCIGVSEGSRILRFVGFFRLGEMRCTRCRRVGMWTERGNILECIGRDLTNCNSFSSKIINCYELKILIKSKKLIEKISLLLL